MYVLSNIYPILLTNQSLKFVFLGWFFWVLILDVHHLFMCKYLFWRDYWKKIINLGVYFCNWFLQRSCWFLFIKYLFFPFLVCNCFILKYPDSLVTHFGFFLVFMLCLLLLLLGLFVWACFFGIRVLVYCVFGLKMWK